MLPQSLIIYSHAVSNIVKTTHEDFQQLLSNKNSDTNDNVSSQDIDTLLKYDKMDYICDFGCHFNQKTDEQIQKANKARKKLLFASALCIIFMIIELIGGYIAHSIALMSDALHLLSDCGGLMISVVALWVAQKDPTDKLTYGYHRAEIIGALFSVFLIWSLTVWILYEAIDRLIHPQDVNGEIMFAVSCCGIIVNISMSGILHQGHEHHHNDNHSHCHHDHSQINVRSAFIHALGDLLQSIGVLIAASLIWYDNERFRIADAICTIIFSIIVICTTVNLMRDILSVLMESVPFHIDITEIALALTDLTDVAQVHDLHVWNLSMGKPSLSVHLLVRSSTLDVDDKIVPVCADAILRKAQALLIEQFNIHHSTIQIECAHNDGHHHNEYWRRLCPSYCDNYQHSQERTININFLNWIMHIVDNVEEEDVKKLMMIKYLNDALVQEKSGKRHS